MSGLAEEKQQSAVAWVNGKRAPPNISRDHCDRPFSCFPWSVISRDILWSYLYTFGGPIYRRTILETTIHHRGDGMPVFRLCRTGWPAALVPAAHCTLFWARHSQSPLCNAIWGVTKGIWVALQRRNDNLPSLEWKSCLQAKQQDHCDFGTQSSIFLLPMTCNQLGHCKILLLYYWRRYVPKYYGRDNNPPSRWWNAYGFFLHKLGPARLLCLGHFSTLTRK